MRTNYWENLEPEVIYHIYNRAIGRENLFIDADHYTSFLQKWKTHLPYLEVYAFCLMPNHFHFLVKVKPLSKALLNHVQAQKTVKSRQLLDGQIPYHVYLEDQFKRLLSSYALSFNLEQGRHGSLFQKRFKRISIQDDCKLHYLLAYIHHNPIHHHFCSDFADWKYSSWAAYQNLNQPSLLNREAVLGWFDADIETATRRFQKYHADFRTDRQLQAITFEVTNDRLRN